MICRLTLTLLIVVATAPALAQIPNQPLPAAPKPMRFEWVREGPAETCADRCREWISATGSIVESTVRDFEIFARQREVKGAVVVLESTGGAVAQGLALGREFRRLAISTTIGKTVAIPSDGEPRAALLPRANCNSMCVFLLLGGINRHVPDEARVLVHQIWPSSKRNDANAATYSAANVVSVQRMLGQIARHVVDMGADIELFEIATRIPPWEQLRPLSKEELRRLRIHTVENVFASKARPEPAAATSKPTANVAVPASANPALGWTSIERQGQRILARRHPITIEGQEIGAFEISFACSDKPGVYRVHYQEKRIAPGLAGNDRLDAVGISVRQERSLLRALLKVEVSKSGKAPTELISIARGIVPSSFLDTFASASNQTLTVATTTTNKIQTSIRLGHSGFSEALRAMSAGCPASVPN